MTATRDQQLARSVFDRVGKFKTQHTRPDGTADEKRLKQYGSMSHKLPVMIRSAGLAQALGFIEGKGKKESVYAQLLTDLAATIGLSPEEKLPGKSRLVPLDEYMLLTQNALAALLWFKRYAQSVLGVEAGEEPADENDNGELEGAK